jgi:hypothetical protein
MGDGRDSTNALSLPKYVALIMVEHCATSWHHFIGSPELTSHGFVRDEQQQNPGPHDARFHCPASKLLCNSPARVGL